MAEARSLLGSCSVRQDLLSGLRVSSLAVDLDAIVSDEHQTLYDDPKIFFDMTYPTEALSTVAGQVFGRVSGSMPNAPGVFLLGTTLGGGKSHLLASLYHLARNGSGILPDETKKEVGDIQVPKCRVAVLTQNSPAGERGPPRTMWGHLAQQLGAYEVMAEADRELRSPSKDSLLALLGESPTVILVDEVTNYLIRAAAVSVGGGTLAEQTRVFLQDLEEVVDLRTSTSMVLSQLPQEFDPTDEKQKEVLEKSARGKSGAEAEEIKRRAMRESRISQSLLMRKAEIYNPVRDDLELVNILRRWIFQNVRDGAAEAAAQAYAAYYESPGPRGLLPPDAVGERAKERMIRDYPFHPKTISLIRAKFGQAPRFMQTRGALLLMIQAIRLLMDKKPSSMLVHPTHLDPRDVQIREFLSKRVFDDPRLENAIHTELVGKGGEARASKVDDVFKDELGTRITSAVLLESALVVVRGERDILVGAPRSEILHDVLEPGEDETRVEQALQAVLDTSYHIVEIVKKLVFKGEVNINKHIEEREKDVKHYQITNETQRRLTGYVLRGGEAFRKITWPTTPEDIPDTAGLKLVVMAPESPWWLPGTQPSKDLNNLFLYKNQSREPRIHRNSQVLLAPNSDQKDRVEEIVRHYLAVKDVSEDEEFKKDLSDEQKRMLEREKAKSEAMTILRIGMAYNLLYYPSAQGPYDKPLLVGAKLSPNETELGVDSTDWKVSSSRFMEMLLARLKDVDKWRGESYTPDYLVDKVFTPATGTTPDSKKYGELESAFYKNPKLAFLESKNLIRQSVIIGIQDGSFLALSGERVHTTHTTGELIIHEDSEIIRKGTERWSKIAGQFCLNCGYRKQECKCGGPPPPPPPPTPPDGDIVFKDMLLKSIPEQVPDKLAEQRAKADSMTIFVNKPGDVSFILRLIGTLSSRKVEVGLESLNLNITRYGDQPIELLVRADKPSPVWGLLRGSVEGLLAKLAAGEGAGNASTRLVLSFSEPVDPDTLKGLLRPFSMTGAEKIKADTVVVRTSKEQSDE